MSDDKDRIRQRAYQIWLEEGRPQGREAAHWDMARELVAIEDNQKTATKPVRRASGDPQKAGDTVEPTAPAASAGEVPTTTDAGEQIYPPSREAAKSLAGTSGSARGKAPPSKPTRPSSPPSRNKRG